MDFKSLIQSKLNGFEKCVNFSFVYVINEKSKQAHLMALVESNGEHGIFLFRLLEEFTGNSADIVLNLTCPIDTSFKFGVGSARDSEGARVFVPLTLQCGRLSKPLSLRIPQDSEALLGDLKRASSLATASHSFRWMNSYSSKHSSSNASANDSFDPFAKNASKNLPLHSSASARQAPSRVGSDFVNSENSHKLEKASSVPTFLDSWPGVKVADAVDGRRSHTPNDRDTKPDMTAREKTVQLIMESRDEEFTDRLSLRFFCGTWNVNGQPASERLDAWLCEHDIISNPPDVYAVGFQELDLSTNAYIFSESVQEGMWFTKVRDALATIPNARYIKVQLVRLVGIMLVVFIKDTLAPKIGNVATQIVATGIMGVMGNKGGVCVRFTVCNTSVCCVACHLAAHPDQLERRNQDFRDINGKVRFSVRPYAIAEHDVVLWCGDMNYRLELDGTTAKSMIEQHKFKELLGHDQLTNQVTAKRVFENYVEPIINFRPTYKYDVGTDNWDSSEKNRAPAWCDRVLWKGGHVKPLSYRSHSQLRLSDHKPVSCLFEVGVKVHNRDAYQRVYEDVMRMMDKRENDFLPQVKLSAFEVQFPNVKFIESQRKSVVVSNIGQAPVQFSFISKPNDTTFCKSWLSVTPNSAIIPVGEQVELILEVYVNKDSVAALSCGRDHIEDILILHLEGGKDFFITVSGSYQQTCFGLSLDDLCRMFQPIRGIDTAQLIDVGLTNTSTAARPLDIPKEMWRLVDHLYRRCHGVEGLFEQPGLDSEVQQIRDCLDTGVPNVIPGGVHSVVESLLLFLESLDTPIILDAYYDQCLQACHNYTLCKQVVGLQPPSHRNTFRYLCAFLKYVIDESLNNPVPLDARKLAHLFGPIVLRPPQVPGQAQAAVSSQQQKMVSSFVYQFLVNQFSD